jgi:plasmid stability protein
MVTVTICNLSDVTHRALKMRAARNHRSLEAEIREILNDAVFPARPVKGTKPSRSELKLGTELAKLGRRFGGIDLKID